MGTVPTVTFLRLLYVWVCFTAVQYTHFTIIEIWVHADGLISRIFKYRSIVHEVYKHDGGKYL
ncbi:hypothetical protein SAMN02910456_00666 [Ruminococcaceae bacterium YRB3002]|nr:hypothetical protein SAMN02910456_00666 [Ruminococcaceae bacterium YRB3002]